MNLNKEMPAEYAVANLKDINNDLDKIASIIKDELNKFIAKHNYMPIINRYSHREGEGEAARDYLGHAISVHVEEGEQGWTLTGSKIMQDEDFPEHNR